MNAQKRQIEYFSLPAYDTLWQQWPVAVLAAAQAVGQVAVGDPLPMTASRLVNSYDQKPAEDHRQLASAAGKKKTATSAIIRIRDASSTVLLAEYQKDNNDWANNPVAFSCKVGMT